MYVRAHTTQSKLMAILLMLMLCITFTLQSVQETQAMIPLVPVPQLAIIAGAALLTAAGIEFATNADARAAGYRFVNSLADSVKTSFIAAAVAGATIPIIPELWAAVTGHAKTYADGTAQGTVQVLEAGNPVTLTGTGAQTVSVTQATGDIFINLTNLGVGASISLSKNWGSLNTIRRWDGSVYWTHLRWTPAYGQPGTAYDFPEFQGNSVPSCQISMYNDGVTGASLIVNLVKVCEWATPLPLNGTGTSNISWAGIDTGSVTLSNVYTQPITGTSYTINNNYYGNPADDWSNHNVTVPQTYDGVVTGNPGNVLTDAGSIVTAPGTATTSENLLSQILTGVRSLGATITGAVTGVLTLDTTETINYQPLELTGDLFTTRFPFSIPWDIQRAVVGMGSGSASAPVWTVTFPASPWTPAYQIAIDLSTFDSIIPAVRAGELFLFTMGLALATRKILGGAA